MGSRIRKSQDCFSSASSASATTVVLLRKLFQEMEEMKRDFLNVR
jgi:hypothetical protein